MRPRRRYLAVPLCAALVLVGCHRSTAPAGTPFVTGPIQQILPDGRLRVADESGGCGAIVSVGTKTTVDGVGSGAAATRPMLPVGQRVAVWITGAVRESCPAQVSAQHIRRL